MEKITEYLETNFKLAYKSVTFHFKQFVWFYIAFFIVQSLLGIVSMSMHINTSNTRKDISSMYNSHYVFYYMNTNQKLYLQNAANYYFKDEYFFDIKEIKEYGKETEQNYKCDVYISFTEDPIKGYERFRYKYLSGLEELGTVYSASTPLYELENDIQQTETLYRVYILVISAFSFILLSVLYHIRSNNYRFDYGIYMAFGADKKKLLNTSFWEMTVIALLTFIPSLLFSGIINYILTGVGGLTFSLSLSSCLRILLLTLLINSLSVLFVVVKTALKTPISLIVSRDNSNMVHSPRVSSDLFKKKPLNRIIDLSMRRYVKYYSVLILTGVLFSALFVCAVFCGSMYSEKQNEAQPQFEVTFNDSVEYTDTDREEFLSYDGITGTYKEQSAAVMGLNEHILVNKANTLFTANRVVFDEEYVAMDNVTYYAADSEVIEYLEKNRKYTGDLSSILTAEDTVIITDSFNNTTHFDFKPGDKIKLADYYTKIYEPDLMLYGKELLKERLRCYVFLYKEYTVGAVIHSDCADENIKIYMNHDLYEEKTESKVSYKTVYLYADQNLTHRQYEKLYSDILKINEIKYRGDNNTVNVFVRNLYADVNRTAEANTRFSTKLFVISVLILLVSSIVWFFSQSLFYGKRSNEFTVLRSVGLTLSEIKAMFMRDASIISSIGLVCYFALSYLFCYIVYKFMNSWLFYYTFRFSFSIPSKALIAGAVATIVFAFVSTFITYFIYKKKTTTTVPEG